jgi:ADP-ribose pyrophosphatase
MSDETLREVVIGSEPIYEGRIVRLRVDRVRLPNGREAKREIVAHPGAVCIVPVTEANEVLLVRQFRLAAGRSVLEVPAGTLEPGEDPRNCADRELREETGFRASSLHPMFAMFVAPGYSSEKIHAFLATGLTPAAGEADEDENLLPERMPLQEVERRILAGEFEDAKTIASLLGALRLLGVQPAES